MSRISTWETALADYLASKRNAPFEYGSHDCCSFSGGAIEVMTGTDPMAEFRGQYDSLKTSIKALREIGEGDLEKTLDAKFETIPIGFAQRGDLAFFDDCVGIVAGAFAWFVSDDGLERVERSMWDKAWRVGHG